MYFSISV
jgi:hypothetical protein